MIGGEEDADAPVRHGEGAVDRDRLLEEVDGGVHVPFASLHAGFRIPAEGLERARETVQAVAEDYSRLQGAAPPEEAAPLLERLKGAPT